MRRKTKQQKRKGFSVNPTASASATINKAGAKTFASRATSGTGGTGSIR